MKIVCDCCKEELKRKGGLLFSPPNKSDLVKKTHLCCRCYGNVAQWLRKCRAPA
jgi:hypothetical protein